MLGRGCVSGRNTDSRPAKMGGNVNAESRSEVFHVVHVLLSRGIAISMTQHLNLWSQSSNALALDDAAACKSGGREDPVRSILHPINTVAHSIKGDPMDIDL